MFTKSVFGLKMVVVQFRFDVSRCYKVGYGECGRMGETMEDGG